MAGRFVLDQDTAGRYRFILVGDNGETVAIGEGYTTKAAALSSIDLVRRIAPTSRVDDRTEPRESPPRMSSESRTEPTCQSM